MENKKLDIALTLADAFRTGIKNIPSVLGTYILWVLTIWIPYINIGTTIALSMMPLKMADGGIVNPLYIFESKYRKYMGEYLLTCCLMTMAIVLATLFMIVPGIVLSVSWSLALLFLIGRDLNPLQAMRASNNATQGSKWSIFFVQILLAIIILAITYLILLIPVISYGFESIFSDSQSLISFFMSWRHWVAIVIIWGLSAISHAANASVWRQLKDNI